MLVDAGPLYAALDSDDAHHAACRELLENASGPLFVPMLVVSEVAYFLATRLGPEAEVRFLGDLAAGVLLAEPVAAHDWMRIAELVWTYRDMRLGTVDASILAAAERLGESVIATLDRRHFGAVRPRHTEALQILP
jgi:predicted nucleic acid-binding protein